MRSDLGRLAAIAEILQVGSFLRHNPEASPIACLSGHVLVRAAMLGVVVSGGIFRGKCREHPMKVLGGRILGAAAVVAWLASPAHAQIPAINLTPDKPSKSQEEKDYDAARDKAYKESLKKIPDAKAPADPWGSVRSVDTAKTSSPVKPRTNTGSSAN